MLAYSFDIVRNWANWAGNGAVLNWEEIAQSSSDDSFGLRTYFPKLEQDKRLQYLMYYTNGMWIDYHELQFCLSMLDPSHQEEYLKKFPLQVLRVLMDWPAQEILLDVTELLWPYLSEQNF
ncbi:hypothetical protein TNIN_465251 [Trichonephila inaurata madagascariensis]|uniref:Uncharacterized protein n=1 Tax=Trichonephila inaurata madagascariensis TaxID=2747483 RepID=A0A8X6X9A0_9ARAC|nr:hypothetical protein TNIN_465251 [Trichonephila inaurata madagascariensis]